MKTCKSLIKIFNVLVIILTNKNFYLMLEHYQKQYQNI